jgi:hypothetical protein
MRKVPTLSTLIDDETDPVWTHANRGNHLSRRLLIQNLATGTAQGGLYFNDEPRQIAVTLPTFDGGRPSRIWTMVGSGMPGS